MNLLVVAISTLVGSILTAGLCNFIHGYLLPDKTETEKYKFFRAMTSFSLAIDEGLKDICFHYMVISIIAYMIVSTSLPKNYRWIAIAELLFSAQLPYLMASFSLRQIEGRETMDRIDLRRQYRGEVIRILIVISILATCQGITELSYGIATMLSAVITTATIAAIIWLMDDGGKRLLRRLRKKLKKLFETKPRLVPVPQN